MRNIRYTLLILILGSSLSTDAQTDSLAINAEKVEVIKRYEASILQARKKKISFDVEKSEKPPINYNYNVTTEKVIDFDRPDPEIRALSYDGEPTVDMDSKDGYVYAAYGTHKTINAGAAYHYYIEDWLDAGFRIDHFSAEEEQLISRDSIVNINYLSKLRNTNADLYLGYNLGLQSKLLLKGYTKIINHNATPSYNFGTEAIQNLPINKYGVDLGFSHNVFEDNGFVVRLNGGYDFTRNKQDEHITDKVYRADLNVFKEFTEKFSLELPIGYRSTGVTSDLDTIGMRVGDVILEPNFRLRGANYNVKAGVQYITGDSASYLFPIVDISMPSVIAGIDLRLYTESTYLRNSMSNISEINPYFNGLSADYSPNYTRSYNLDVAYPLSNFKFGLGFAYSQYENSNNFIDFSLTRTTTSTIDRDELSIKPQVEYKLAESVTLALSGRYNFFLKDSIQGDLFYQPKFSLDLESEQLLLDDKLVISEHLVYNSSRKVSSRPDVGSFLDLALQARYRISPTFDVFVKGTNLFGAEYYLWNNQNVFQQQLWGGLKVRI